MPKNWCFWTVMLEKTLVSPLNSKEIQPVHPKGDQSWIFIGRTDAEAEIPILWPPDMKNWLIGKPPDAGKDWKWKEKGTTRMRWLDGITDSIDMSLCDEQGSLASMGNRSWWRTGKPGVYGVPFMGWQRVKHDWMTELNWTDK